MARRSTIAGELGLGSQTGGGSTSGAITRDTSILRTGLASIKADSTASNVAAVATWATPFALGVAWFARIYFRFDALPGQTLTVMRYGGAQYPSIRVKTTGKVILADPSNTQIGSDSAGTLVLGSWAMLELMLTIGTGATDAAEARLNGTSIASAAAQSWSDVLPTALNGGWLTAPGASKALYMDDIAVNDASGTDQTSWPGSGRVSILVPVSVSAQGAWTIGSGGSIPAALANQPPQGEADNANSTKQARSVSATANETLSVVTGTYDSQIPSGATITLVQPFADHAEGATAGTKNLDLAVSANPAGSTSAAFTAGGDAGAAGAWPTNWRGTFGTPVIAPTPTRSTGATLTIRDATTNTNAVDVDQMALLVEWTAGGANIDRSGSAVLSGAASASRNALRDRSGRAVLAGAASGSRSALRDRSGRAVLGLYAAGSQDVVHTTPPTPTDTGGAGGATWRPPRGLEQRTGALVDRSGAAILALYASGRGQVERADPDVEALLLAGVL